MHERDIEYTCPLGSDCETIKNNQMHRCRWYVKIEGADPNTAKPTEEWSCAIAWMPLLQIESSMHTRQGNVGIESLRNEVASSRAPTTTLVGNIKRVTMRWHLRGTQRM